MTKTMLTLHRWLGLGAGVLILIAACTALGMNHADQLSGLVEHGGPSEGPYGEHVLAVAVDPEDADHVLMGTTGGLFASTDGGHAWQALGLQGRVGALVQAPSRLYAAVGPDRVLESRDMGVRWTPVQLPFAQGEDIQVRGLTLDHDRLVVATNQGLFRETAAGWASAPRPDVPGVERARWLQATMERLHMGDVWGRFGVPVTDVAAIALLLLTLTGYVLFISREIKVRMARRRVRITLARQAASKVAA